MINIPILSIHLLRQGLFPGVTAAWSEFVFDKTIDDFPDHMIDNLDDQTDTNFIVYAKDVKLISSGDNNNHIVSADHENLIYTISAPDEQIKNLKKDDVFFMEPNAYCAQGILVKVKKSPLRVIRCYTR